MNVYKKKFITWCCFYDILYIKYHNLSLRYMYDFAHNWSYISVSDRCVYILIHSISNYSIFITHSL